MNTSEDLDPIPEVSVQAVSESAWAFQAASRGVLAAGDQRATRLSGFREAVANATGPALPWVLPGPDGRCLVIDAVHGDPVIVCEAALMGMTEGEPPAAQPPAHRPFATEEALTDLHLVLATELGNLAKQVQNRLGGLEERLGKLTGEFHKLELYVKS